MHGRKQAVLGRALEVSGSTGGLVPRDLRNVSLKCKGRSCLANFRECCDVIHQILVVRTLTNIKEENSEVPDVIGRHIRNKNSPLSYGKIKN